MRLYVYGQECPQWLERTSGCTPLRFGSLLTVVWKYRGRYHLQPFFGSCALECAALVAGGLVTIRGGGGGVILYAPVNGWLWRWTTAIRARGGGE
jgi:hypothetical protein